MQNFKLPSVMSHSFAEVPNVSLPRSSFDRSHGYKNYLMNKIGRVAGQGKPRPAFRPIPHKPGKNVVATA